MCSSRGRKTATNFNCILWPSTPRALEHHHVLIPASRARSCGFSVQHCLLNQQKVPRIKFFVSLSCCHQVVTRGFLLFECPGFSAKGCQPTKVLIRSLAGRPVLTGLVKIPRCTATRRLYDLYNTYSNTSVRKRLYFLQRRLSGAGTSDFHLFIRTCGGLHAMHMARGYFDISLFKAR